MPYRRPTLIEGFGHERPKKTFATLPMPATSTHTVRLDLLPEQHWATVVDVTVPHSAADRELVLRLVELGFVPGEHVRIVAEGINGRDPIAVRVGHTTFALRRHEASFILVEPHA